MRDFRLNGEGSIFEAYEMIQKKKLNSLVEIIIGKDIIIC